MNKNTVMFVVLAVIFGFVAGFLVANKLNRSEMDSLRGVAARSGASNSNSAAGDDESLSNDEIRAKIAEADANPTNLTYQKNLGISLYRYGAMKESPEIVGESKRILERAASIDPKDFDVLVALGNAYFDIGFFKKDAASFATARETYQKALTVKPADADVETDIGISYFVQEPPDYERAVSKLKSVVAANPKHDRAMQFLVQAYAKQGNVAEAEKALAKIIELNPTNPAIPDLRKAIMTAKDGPK